MDFFNKIGKKATETYKITKEKTNKISEEFKLRSKISENKEKMEESFLQIGKCVFNEFNGGEKCDKLEEKCNEIKSLKEENEKMEEKLLDIKNMKKCIKCGEEIAKASVFCNKCGEKQPEIEEVEVKEEPTEEAKEAEVEIVEEVKEETEISEEDKKEE